MGIRNLSLAVLLIALSACSAKRNLVEERQRTSPPQNKKDVGVVLEGAKLTEVDAILQAHPEAQVRVLNPEHGMYEIFGVDNEQIRREFDGSSSANQFFELTPPKPIALLSAGAPAGLKVGDLAACVPSTEIPDAVLSVDAPASTIDTIDLGQSVKVNGLKSKTADGTPLKMAIVVIYPNAAPVPQVIQNATALEFKPDTLGLHQVFLVVQDGKNVCALDAIRFIVTANRPFNGNKAPDVSVDLSKLKHLAMVQAEASWKVSEGEGITIAIIDTGVNYNHPTLAPNILVNEKEIPANNIDDEKNGFIDDYVGYDFANQDGSPYDDDGHGTHVAGLAASRHFGLARHAKILPIKALSSIGGDAGTIAAAIRYAVDRGANIVNMSLGGEAPMPHPAMVSAANYAEQKGVLMIVAAGNGDQETGLGYDIEQIPVFPARLTNANLVTVAAFDAFDVLSPYSNFGAHTVHVVAPGGFTNDMMYSAAFENPRGALMVGLAGTSMAAPVVSGIAAQVWSNSPHLSFKDVKATLMAAGSLVPELKNVTVSGRHIDALSAVQISSAKNVLF